MLSLQVVLLFVALLLFVFRWRTKSFFDLANEIPGYSGLQAIKVFKQLHSNGAEDFYQSFLKVGKPFKSAFKLMLGPVLLVTIRDAEDVKIVYNHKNTHEKHMMYKRFFDNGLVVSGGDEQKLRKKMATPIFYPAKLKTFLPIMNVRMRNFIKRLKAKSIDEEFDISNVNFDFTLDILLSTIFERDVKDEVRVQYVNDVTA